MPAEVVLVQPPEVGERAFTGVVSARVQSSLGFRVPGKVIERLVDTGQGVHQGQPLMRLDRTDYAHGITTQVGNVDAARARLQQTAADEVRYGGLDSSGAVSQSAYEQVKTRFFLVGVTRFEPATATSRTVQHRTINTVISISYMGCGPA